MDASTRPAGSQAKMNVPLLDLQAQYAALREQMRAAIDRIMESQHFILGAEVQALEDEVARYCGTKHAIGCASGSDALLLALMALEIGANDEVITTPYSFFATVSAITRLGARPVFVDIDPRTYNIDASRVEAAITERTRAIMPVHLYGQCTDMEALAGLSERHNIPLVEDAAQAIGAEDRVGRAGSIGAIGCLSFYPTKNLGGAGDGGMMTTNDASLAERLRILRVHGESSKYHHRFVGINSRLDALQAAVLRVKLPFLDGWSDARREHAERYAQLFTDAGLTEELGLPFVRDHARHIFNQYVIRAGERRDELLAHLKQNGVGAEIYYPLPLHLQECFRFLGHTEGDFPISEKAARETLAIPVYPELSPEQQQYVVETIRRFY